MKALHLKTLILVMALGLLATGCTTWAVEYDGHATTVRGSAGYTVYHDVHHRHYDGCGHFGYHSRRPVIIERPPVVVIPRHKPTYRKSRDWDRNRYYDRDRGRDRGRDYGRSRGRGKAWGNYRWD